MEYKITCPEFEGPLDLLLHLIKDANIDICDISIEVITKQYLEYIEKFEQLNLNITSEYLVMAAELIEMKSLSLLPKREQNMEDDYEENPRQKLIRKLLEYEKYKTITNALKECENKRNEIYTKEPSDLDNYIGKSDKVDEQFSLDDLLNAFTKLLEKKEFDKPLSTKITNKGYSINERSSEINTILKERKRVAFIDLFDFYTKEYLVVTFLSILDLAKKQEINIIQKDNFNNIFLESRGCE